MIFIYLRLFPQNWRFEQKNERVRYLVLAGGVTLLLIEAIPAFVLKSDT
jgi:hypothetical protein